MMFFKPGRCPGLV